MHTEDLETTTTSALYSKVQDIISSCNDIKHILKIWKIHSIAGTVYIYIILSCSVTQETIKVTTVISTHLNTLTLIKRYTATG